MHFLDHTRAGDVPTSLTDIAVRQAKPTGKNYTFKNAAGLWPCTVRRCQGCQAVALSLLLVGQAGPDLDGRYPAVSLEEARVARVEARALVAQGIDPCAPTAWQPVLHPRMPFVPSMAIGTYSRP
ncbi:Arm DNA-binding domain-containing protein [Stenotrophomonas maltophilia]|uniref:Arm DNA-binding domain-containing protein n=1 Tax=Stenotrophomonas maltophilia TaxID=40324 RepID=UPI0038C80140